MTQHRHPRGIDAPPAGGRPPKKSLVGQLRSTQSKADKEAQFHEMDSDSRPPSYRSRPEREDDIESRAAESAENVATRNASTTTGSTQASGTVNAPTERTAAPTTRTPNRDGGKFRLAEHLFSIAIILAMIELGGFSAHFMNFSHSWWPVEYPGVIIAVLSFGHYWFVQGIVTTLKKRPFTRDNGTIDLSVRRWGMLYVEWVWFLDIVAPFISAGVAIVVYIERSGSDMIPVLFGTGEEEEEEAARYVHEETARVEAILNTGVLADITSASIADCERAKKV
ncbi:hypothetical protein LTR20_007016 [Exophiala xenobiotica]|nr:hypothetical protein LTR40_008141 [Exophiala xenobiotica]KAK5380541.1 hypothetical protein LTS13_003400 [Exophiala xenobiotica]KAK5412020.1 hypothetical protein LTR90_007581 [Exophiala xenobiotica]KAK5460591.1 hypothetical protein LTR20_007016 [Exophiala xenobiotica]KAK5481275.1 hypothetical protein LTR26_007110 [Exophiala xenobiotica]